MHPQRLGMIAPDADIWPRSCLRPNSRYCETRESAADEASAASGPRFVIVARIRMSSSAALAYSIVMSKKRFSRKTPVSQSSNSGSIFERSAFRLTSSS